VNPKSRVKATSRSSCSSSGSLQAKAMKTSVLEEEVDISNDQRRSVYHSEPTGPQARQIPPMTCRDLETMRSANTPANPDRSGDQRHRPQLAFTTRGLIALKVRIVFAKQEALQSLRLAKDVPRYTLPFQLKEVGQPVNCVGDVPVNQRIALAQL